MENFRIVHITDLHIADYPNFENLLLNKIETAYGKTEWFLKEIFTRNSPFKPSSFSTDVAIKLRQQIVDMADYFDAVVITGDISSTGLNSDLFLARDFIMGGKVPANWNPFLQQYDSIAEKFPVILMPGNHDRYNGAALFPGGREFESVFGDDWQSGQSFLVNQTGTKVRGVPLEKNGKYLHILCADFTLQSAVQSIKNSPLSPQAYMGQGCVSQTVLDDLIGETNRIKELRSNDLVIWATHFPPQYPKIAECLELIDGEKLSNAAKSCGVFLIISGHTHSDKHYEASSVPVICTGTACAYGKDEKQSFSVIEISINETEPTYHVRPFCWNEKDCSFIEL